MTAFGWWLVGLGGLILAGIAVPYGILSGHAASLAVPIFWLIFAVAVVGMIWAGIRKWRV